MLVFVVKKSTAICQKKKKLKLEYKMVEILTKFYKIT